MASVTESLGYIDSILDAVGRKTSQFVTDVGKVLIFFWHTLRWTFSRPFYAKNVFKQMEQIGVNSIPVVITTALSTGMVLALQELYGFQTFWR